MIYEFYFVNYRRAVRRTKIKGKPFRELRRGDDEFEEDTHSDESDGDEYASRTAMTTAVMETRIKTTVTIHRISGTPAVTVIGHRFLALISTMRIRSGSLLTVMGSSSIRIKGCMHACLC
jgi:hypothetical protein